MTEVLVRNTDAITASKQDAVRLRAGFHETDPAATGGQPRSASSGAARIAVVIITCGRPSILRDTLRVLNAQTRRADEIIVSAVETTDVGDLVDGDRRRIVYGSKGACRQRNTALANIPGDTDLVIFFDDDFLPHPRWIEAVEQCFVRRPTVNCITGYLLADGVKGGGLSVREGMDLINRYRGELQESLQEGYSPYGCNMAFRRSAMDGLGFDERLVLYGWLEDRDFGAMVAKRGGKQIKLGTAVGVHLGVNRGRLSGRRLGYSQIVNPIYIFRKRNMSFWQLADHVLRNFGMNSTRCLFPEGHIDRAGRLLGNLLGLVDIARGVVEPERAEQLR